MRLLITRADSRSGGPISTNCARPSTTRGAGTPSTAAGNWKANSVTACLDHRAGPLLQGSFSDEIGRELFSVTAELSRLAGWTAFDVGEHEVAQRHFIQALRLARAGGDVQLGCYGDEPAWIDFYHHARLSADAAEVFRDLKNPKAALGWNQRAAAMPTGVFTRSVGMRLAIVGTAHLQARDLDHGHELGHRSVDILARVQSSRAKDYVREFSTALAPWRRGPAVREFIHRTCKELGVAA